MLRPAKGHTWRDPFTLTRSLRHRCWAERVKYKLSVMAHRCLSGCAPQYLATYCIPVSSLPLGSICVLLFVISWRYRLTASARMVVGLSQLPARRRGTHCQHTVVMWRTAPLHLDDYLRLICFLSTSVCSALGVSAIMRYINRCFTYLLTYMAALADRRRSTAHEDDADAVRYYEQFRAVAK